MSSSLTRTVRCAAGDVFDRLVARSARLLLRTLGVQQKTIACALALGLSVSANAATPPNTPISNTATASYSVGTGPTQSLLSTAKISTATCIDVGVKVELMQYISPARQALAPANAASEIVNPSFSSPSGSLTGPFVQMPTPALLGTTVPATLPSNLLLVPVNDAAGKRVTAYSRNEPIFLRVVSYGANISGTVADTVAVTVTTANSGDSEVVQLTETGPSTGVFVGLIASVYSKAATKNDGRVSISNMEEEITATYAKPNCVTGTNVTSSSSGLVDPYGVLFDSKTGIAVDGAKVNLIDTATNLPAVVYCDDGVTVLPQPLTTGTPSKCDTSMVPGGYRFPQVPAGTYRLEFAPPAGHIFPSKVMAANLPALVGLPALAPSILGNPQLPIRVTAPAGGSYGGLFSLWGPALKIDVPVDSGAVTLTIQKTAGKTVVGTGEYLPYTLSMKNNTASALLGTQIVDHLPVGFRYQKGSAKLDGVAIADPVIAADGQTLTFTMDIAASSTVSLVYVVEVTAGARIGNAENTAAAIGAVTSNTGRASVLVREDLYRNKAILIGRVIDVSGAGNAEFENSKTPKSYCDNRVDNDLKGLAKARIVMQDGTYILSDNEGRWHIDNLRSGTHVVQLDLDSLPKDYEVVQCEENDRFAGRLYSQFVNLQGGSLWRADFYVRKKAPIAMRVSQTLSAHAKLDETVVNFDITSSTEVTGYSATVMLPDDVKYVQGSMTLNGKSIADPDVVGGVLILRSLARPAKWQDKYQFSLGDVGPKTAIQSFVRFTPPGRAAQSTALARITMVNHAPVSATGEANVLVEKADSRPAKTSLDDDPSQLIERLPYNGEWLGKAAPGTEWLHPQASFSPNLPVVKVAVKSLPGQSLKLLVNGEPVSALNYDGSQMNASRTVSLSLWSAVPLNYGDNKMELIVTGADGKEVSHEVRNIHYATAPDHVELLPLKSRLVADGKTRSMVAVRFLDKDGYPVRRGVNGEFQLNEPYRSWDRLEGMERQPLTGRVGGKARYEVGTDGVAMIQLEPTTQSGEAVLDFQFSDARTQQLRAWLEPGQRDWILVGFAEGTAGYKTLSGNVQALKEANVDNQLFDGNKLAFYAKGTIKGEFLLTAAYDTAKQIKNGLLKQAVDPTQYYTLYADATQAQYDAASTNRLYVKLERKQFYAMFGDYDTGLTVTELSRYSRTVNGVKSEFKGENMGYNAFATVTSQAFVKDEIQGNGTSGVYKMSRGNIVINSDKIRVETRDRFQSQNIVSVQTMTRYLDYDIDYNIGTLVFREPILSRDSNFNPTYIVAEFESADPLDNKATYGGRGNFKPTKELELGATAVHEGTVGATGNLTGLDATYKIGETTKVRAEYAATDRNRSSVVNSGSAWLGEVLHHETNWDAKAYMREQTGGFGVGQQAPSEISTRKMGLDGRIKLTETTQFKGQAYKQDNLSTGANNIVVDGRMDERINQALTAYYGARVSRDSNVAGNSQSNQLLAGAGYTALGGKLTLRAAGEVSAGTAGSVIMPNRLILGSDYKLTEQTKAFAEQEFARGEKISANTTRAGLRTQPWMGAEMSASVANSFSNDAERMYGNLGMVQRWQITEHWQTDFSVDRTQTLKNTAAPLQLNAPLPSGNMPPTVGFAGDFTSFAWGGAYHDTLWSGNGRMEFRDSSLSKQKNILFGLQRNLDAGQSIAAGYTLRQADGTTGNTRNSDLRLSYAYRPNDSEWVWFDRADFVTQSTNVAGVLLKGDKLINNFNANWAPNRHTQVALQYGSKYVLDTINNTDYSGYTDLIGAEVRHDLNKDWDVGTFGSVMRSMNAGVHSYGVGASVGYKMMDNMWVSAGYNLRGMGDRDFANATYRGQGPFITLRMKVDQDTFGLNNDGERTRPLSGE